MDAFTFTRAAKLTAEVLAQQIADDWIGTFHDDQYHRLTFRGRAAYRAMVADWFLDQGIRDNGLMNAWDGAFDYLPTPDRYGKDADDQARVESVMTR